MPYAATGTAMRTSPNPANPLESTFDGVGRAGADVKLGVGPNVTIEAALNPDFGQVELDPAEVNLSAFETIFTERRPFFVEGGQLLRGGDASYFYSRRVGGVPAVSVRGAFVTPPANATILGAAKITGRLESGLSVGALGAVSAAEDTLRVVRASEGIGRGIRSPGDRRRPRAAVTSGTGNSSRKCRQAQFTGREPGGVRLTPTRPFRCRTARWPSHWWRSGCLRRRPEQRASGRTGRRGAAAMRRRVPHERTAPAAARIAARRSTTRRTCGSTR
jgi:hypothetical protein